MNTDQQYKAPATRSSPQTELPPPAASPRAQNHNQTQYATAHKEHHKNQKPMPNTSVAAPKQTDVSSSHPSVSEPAKTNPPNNPQKPPKNQTQTASAETLNQTTPPAGTPPPHNVSTPEPIRHPTTPQPRATARRGQYHPVVARSTRNTSFRRGTFTDDPATTTVDPYFRDNRSTASDGNSEASETNPDKQT